jgi:hypothetical protein
MRYAIPVDGSEASRKLLRVLTQQKHAIYAYTYLPTREQARIEEARQQVQDFEVMAHRVFEWPGDTPTNVDTLHFHQLALFSLRGWSNRYNVYRLASFWKPENDHTKEMLLNAVNTGFHTQIGLDFPLLEEVPA